MPYDPVMEAHGFNRYPLPKEKPDTARVVRQSLVHNRLRIQRGQAFVGMLFSTVTVVGVWRNSFPDTSSWLLLLIGGSIYIGLAWFLGYIDEYAKLFNVEQERYSEMNPYWKRLFDKLDDIKRKL